MVKTYSGNYLVLASGMFFIFSANDTLKFEIAPNDDFKFNVFFNFVEDGGERKLEKRVEENNMFLTCLNFGLGAGTSYPLEIATASDKKIFLHFWLETIDSPKQVHSFQYTIYIEK